MKTPQEVAATFPPLSDAQCMKIAGLLSLSEIEAEEQAS